MGSLRVEELFKFATSHAVALKENNIDSPQGYRPDLARLSQDPVLNALTQLGVMRLGCDRAFVSLIDNENQYIVAEMTNSISLFHTSHHAKDDNICIGTKQLDLIAGICAGTMPAFTSIRDPGTPYKSTSNIFADSTRYIINNLAEEPQYADRPYVVGYPYMRYYAEVPITSRAGFVLGTYAVLDNKPGNGLSEEKYHIMHEISMAIMRHMESIKLQEDYDRAMCLLSGVNTFVQTTSNSLDQKRQYDDTPPVTLSSQRLGTNSNPSDDHSKRNLPIPLSTSPTNSAVDDSLYETDGDVLSSQRYQSNTTELSSSYSLGEARSSETSDTDHPAFAQPQVEKGLHRHETMSPVHTLVPENVQATTETTAFDLAEATNACFTRAACLLREALNLEGVVFIQTNQHHFEFQSSTSINPGVIDIEPSMDKPSTCARGVGPSLPATQGRKVDPQFNPISSSTPCSRLGMSIRGMPESDSRFITPSQYSLPQSVQQDVLRICPSGGYIFNFYTGADACLSDATGSSEPVSSTDKMKMEVRRHFPDALSLAFASLWNPYSDSWFATCLAWSTDPKRVLDASEVSYLKGFGNSVMVEVTRLELLATNQAKSDFISCISHELRSPLHGILGSTEMLKESALKEDHYQLVSMIDSCASILLETMDNILHYSKINSAARDMSGAMTATGPTGSDRISGVLSRFKMGALIEETCEALVAGSRYTDGIQRPRLSKSDSVGDTHDSDDLVSANLSADGVTVILRMDHDASQYTRSRSAAWRRCLLNIVGNALKYTSTGYVEIVLQRTMLPSPTDPSQIRDGISLTVRDTGCGIGKAYLKNQLFRPFAQENVHASGTGLGLNIVKSLVDDLEGSVMIESEVDVGTEVTLAIPIGAALQVSPVNRELRPYSDSSICLVGFDVSPDLTAPVTGIMTPAAKRKLAIKDALFTHCGQWLGMRCSTAHSCREAVADILVVTEDDVSLLEEERSRSDPKLESGLRPSWLILCTKYGTENHPEHRTSNQVAYLLPPFGPKQLASAIAGIYRSRSERSPASINSMAWVSNMEAETLEGVDTSSKVDEKSVVSNLPKPNHSRPSKHVLLVDDNDINLRLITRCVRQLRCEYVTATNGQEALEAFKNSKTPFDYVFMDISMPVMNGFESTRAIRKFEAQEGRVQTPIIAMTGLGSETARREAVSSGMSAIWTKPVKMRMVKSLINNSDVFAIKTASMNNITL